MHYCRHATILLFGVFIFQGFQGREHEGGQSVQAEPQLPHDITEVLRKRGTYLRLFEKHPRNMQSCRWVQSPHYKLTAPGAIWTTYLKQTRRMVVLLVVLVFRIMLFHIKLEICISLIGKWPLSSRRPKTHTIIITHFTNRRRIVTVTAVAKQWVRFLLTFHSSLIDSVRVQLFISAL